MVDWNRPCIFGNDRFENGFEIMKFAVVPFPTHLAEDFPELDINPIVMCYFPEKAMKVKGWDKDTVLIMSVESWGFAIREEHEEGELVYELDEEL